MISKDFFDALDLLEVEKNINKEYFIKSLEEALTSGLRKQMGEGKMARVAINPDSKTIRVYSYKTVVATQEEVEDEDKQISLEDAREIKAKYKVGDTVEAEENPKDFKRVAALTVKNVVMQKLKEAEYNIAMEALEEQEGEIISAIIRREDERNVIYLDTGLNQAEGIMGLKDQIPGERYKIGSKIKVFIKKVQDDYRGLGIQVSRSSPEFVRKLFELECPEIRNGEVIIKNIVREAGYRTKLSVYAKDQRMDPIGALVGPKGQRVNEIVAELNGEKIDIIPYSDNAYEFIAASLSPARALEVSINEEEHKSRVIVPQDKLSLAIGKQGQNVRLAAKLTGWKIDVKGSDAAGAPEIKATTPVKKISVDTADISDEDAFSDLE